MLVAWGKRKSSKNGAPKESQSFNNATLAKEMLARGCTAVSSIASSRTLHCEGSFVIITAVLCIVKDATECQADTRLSVSVERLTF